MRYKPTEEQKAKLKEMFPAFFRDKNPESLRTKYLPTMIQRDRDGNLKMSPEIYLANRVTILEDGVSSEVVFSKMPPVVNQATKQITYPDGGVRTRHNMPINPSKDIELLVFLMFYSPQVKNGLAEVQSKNPKITIESKQSEAKAKLDSKRALANFEAMIISDSQLPDDKIISLGRVFGINESDADVLRSVFLTMAERNGKPNMDFIDRFMESSSKDYLKIRGIVDQAYENGIFAQDKDNYDWKIIDPTGGYKFYAKYGQANVKDPAGFLVSYLSGRPADVYKIEQLLRPGSSSKTIVDYNPPQKQEVFAVVKDMNPQEYENFFATAELAWHHKWREEFIEWIEKEKAEA